MKPLILLVLVILPVFVNSEKILFYSLLASYSHLNSIYPLASKLANEGHSVTIISTFRQREPNPKIVEIVPEAASVYVKSLVGELDINIRLSRIAPLLLFVYLSDISFQSCKLALEDESVQKVIKSPNTFDLVFVDGCYNECGFGLAHKFKAPVILFLTSNTFHPWPQVYGYDHENLPNMVFAKPKRQQGILDTVLNFFVPIYAQALKLFMYPKMERLFHTHLQLENAPSLEQLEKNTSLILYNGHYSHDYARSLAPLFVSISGIQIRKSVKPLSPLLSSFVENSPIVLISLGSTVVASKMPVWLRNVFFEFVRRNGQIQFIWRWTGEIPDDTPKNLLLIDWVPQQDILGHPNLKVFITHAGLNSFMEGIYYKAPMLCLPIIGDQDTNSNFVVEHGLGLKLDIMHLTVEEFHDAFSQIVSNYQMYKRKAEFHLRLFKDRPMDPLTEAFWWTEFVLRHNQTTFLQPSGIHKHWWTRYYLTPIFILFLFLILVLVCSITLILKLVSSLKGTVPKVEMQSSKKLK